jgi:hypothetical protein
MKKPKKTQNRPGKRSALLLPLIFIKYRKYRNYMRYVYEELL